MLIAEQLNQIGIGQAIDKGIVLGELRGIENGEREATIKIAHNKKQSALHLDTFMAKTGHSEDELRQFAH